MTAKSPHIYVGVDGGGTRCRVRVRDQSRRLLGSAEAGAANVSLDFAGALQTIRDTIAAAFRSAGLHDDVVPRSAAGLGLAGVSSAVVAERVRVALPRFSAAAVDQDGAIACLGAHGGRDGGLVIAGTGSAAVLRLGGETIGIGGRGFMLGDDGSGAWIGRSIWRLALRARDGMEPASSFLDSLILEFDGDLVQIIAWARTAPSHAFAAYAPQVIAAAQTGDAAAGRVVAAAAAAIGELIRVMAARGAPRIALVGGLAPAIAPQLPPDLHALLVPPIADALEGALMLAGLPLAV